MVQKGVSQEPMKNVFMHGVFQVGKDASPRCNVHDQQLIVGLTWSRLFVVPHDSMSLTSQQAASRQSLHHTVNSKILKLETAKSTQELHSIPSPPPESGSTVVALNTKSHNPRAKVSAQSFFALDRN